MARILITSWPSRRHLSPLLAVAGELRRRGHQVGIHTSAHPCDEIPAGLSHFPFNHVDEEVFTRLVSAGNAINPLRHPLELRKRLRAWLVDSVPDQLRDLTPILADWQPDVLLCDYSMWGPLLVLQETQSVPVAAFAILMTCQLPGPQAAPGFGLPRQTGARRRARTRILCGIRETVFSRHLLHGANALRRAHALPPIADSVVAFTGRMPLYLMPSVPELDGNRTDLPSTVHYIGPCSGPTRLGEASPVEPPDDRSPAPDVWVALESLDGVSAEIQRTVISGLRDLSLQLRLGMDDPKGLADLAPLPENLRAQPLASLSGSLSDAKAVVASADSERIFCSLNSIRTYSRPFFILLKLLLRSFEKFINRFLTLRYKK